MEITLKKGLKNASVWIINSEDIVKSSTNSIYLIPIKTDIREANQSSTVFLFFGPPLGKWQKIITYMLKALFLLLKRKYNFWYNKV